MSDSPVDTTAVTLEVEEKTTKKTAPPPDMKTVLEERVKAVEESVRVSESEEERNQLLPRLEQLKTMLAQIAAYEARLCEVHERMRTVEAGVSELSTTVAKKAEKKIEKPVEPVVVPVAQPEPQPTSVEEPKLFVEEEKQTKKPPRSRRIAQRMAASARAALERQNGTGLKAPLVRFAPLASPLAYLKNQAKKYGDGAHNAMVEVQDARSKLQNIPGYAANVASKSKEENKYVYERTPSPVWDRQNIRTPTLPAMSNMLPSFMQMRRDSRGN